MNAPILASVDLGGSKAAVALGTSDGQFIAHTAIPTQSQDGPHAVLGRIATAVATLARESGARPLALGFGAPGLVDAAAGTTRFLPNLAGQWRDVPLRAILEPQVGCPVALLNDARLATLGELRYGHGRTAGTLVFFTVGTGIGGGVAIDGRLRLGPLGAAGELGHQTILPDGPQCTCGSRGCLETLASGPALVARGAYLVQCGRAPILRTLVDGDIGRITPKDMADAAARGELVVRDELLRAAEYLGIGIANVVSVLHPDVVVIGGGVANLGPLLFDTVRRTVLKRVRMFPADGVTILPSELGERAGLLGGLALAADTRDRAS